VNRIGKQILIVITLLANLASTSVVAEDDWQKTGILQTYFQSYSGPTNRQWTINAGAYLNYDYLESGGIGFGYNYTYTKFDYKAELDEHIFNFSGHYNMYTDALPGKLILRLDAYVGKDTLRYDISNPPAHTGGGGMGRRTSATSNTISESADLSAVQPQLAFINYSKTVYLDLGYAYSEYDGAVTTKVDQVTPTFGLGWNESYDWMQIRGYFIQLNEPVGTFGDDRYESIELKYTHWFRDIPSSNSSIEYWRLTGLAGKRLFAVDSDAAVVYSTADTQTGSLSASVQWKFTGNAKLLGLVNYSRFENESTKDDYDSLLIYLNLQKLW